jgi:UDP-N-acetylglucosamine--N-acetylmuramyl-(pentapeptide) pyrophosphoryl-undecaprenol N-acetylglucosamine transferase
MKPGIAAKFRAARDMGIGILQAGLLLRKAKPAAVVGFGGYPSFPAVFAAQVLGIPTVLHEQNAVLGKANAVLEKRATAIALSWPNTRGLTRPQNSAVTGNPVRAHILAIRDTEWPEPSPFTVLVTGGSQGAGVLSLVVPAACALLPPEERKRMRVFHQARAEDMDSAARVYRDAQIQAEVAPFFSDMPDKLKSCHLFIGRSGASTVTELSAVGRPAVFVPLKHADMQQKHNAAEMVGAGAAWLIMQEDFTPRALAQKMREFLGNPAILADAARKALSCGRADAAQRLADLVERNMGLR